jgi:hypothetical protein
MTTEETLLTVLTVSIVVLILVVLAVLLVVLQTLRKIKKVTTEVQVMTEKGVSAAERMAPFSAAAVGALQVASIFLKKKRK